MNNCFLTTCARPLAFDNQKLLPFGPILAAPLISGCDGCQASHGGRIGSHVLSIIAKEKSMNAITGRGFHMDSNFMWGFMLGFLCWVVNVAVDVSVGVDPKILAQVKVRHSDWL